MTTETQTQFAARMGWHKSRVTRLKKAGRLVMAGDLVDVEASLTRIQATRGTRYDVEERNAAERAAKAVQAELADALEIVQADLNLDEIGRRTRLAQMQEREAVARIRQREEQEQAGLLVRRASIRKALADAAQIILNAAETLPDRLTPVLVGMTEPAQVRGVLRGEVETLLHTVSEQLALRAGESHEEAA